ncbi:MAG: hypothetical protein ACXVDD_20250, partial [Polyangia bacterium]
MLAGAVVLAGAVALAGAGAVVLTTAAPSPFAATIPRCSCSQYGINAPTANTAASHLAFRIFSSWLNVSVDEDGAVQQRSRCPRSHSRATTRTESSAAT